MNETEILANKEVIAALLAEKSPAELDALRWRVAVDKLSGVLHTLLCPADHRAECDYYKEEISTEKGSARAEWLARTERMLQKAKVDTLPGIEEILQTLPLFARTQGQKVHFLNFLTLLIPSLVVHATASPAAPPVRISSSQSGPSATGESPEA